MNFNEASLVENIIMNHFRSEVNASLLHGRKAFPMEISYAKTHMMKNFKLKVIRYIWTFQTVWLLSLSMGTASKMNARTSNAQAKVT